MPRPTALGVPCDICEKDEYWDNRESKKNAKAPDWVCANKECDGKDGFKFGRWEKNRDKWDPNFKKSEKKDEKPKGGRITGDDTTPDERGERVFSWAAYTYTYGKLLGAVVKAFKANEVPVEASAVQAAVATLLIQGDRTHVPLMLPRPVKKDEVAKPAHVPTTVGLCGECGQPKCDGTCLDLPF